MASDRGRLRAASSRRARPGVARRLRPPLRVRVRAHARAGPAAPRVRAVDARPRGRRRASASTSPPGSRSATSEPTSSAMPSAGSRRTSSSRTRTRSGSLGGLARSMRRGSSSAARVAARSTASSDRRSPSRRSSTRPGRATPSRRAGSSAGRTSRSRRPPAASRARVDAVSELVRRLGRGSRRARRGSAAGRRARDDPRRARLPRAATASRSALESDAGRPRGRRDPGDDRRRSTGAIRVGLDRGRARALHARRAQARPARPRGVRGRAATSARRRSAASSPSPAALGIRFLGTGGIGGVHRGYPVPSGRVRRPRRARARRRVLVVCSGVEVAPRRAGDDGATSRRSASPCSATGRDTLPLFYDAEGGPPVPQRVRATPRRRRGSRPRTGSSAAAGSSSRTRRRRASTSRSLIEEAVAEAARAGRLRARRVTPVRARVASTSARGGRTREVNRKLIVANARLAARGRGSVRRAVSLYDTVRDLPLEIDGYDARRRSSCRLEPTSCARRRSSACTGAARRASARTSPTTAEEHDARCRQRGPDPPARRRLDAPLVLASTSPTQPLFETRRPSAHVYVDYRRWAFESAALDLALRQAGMSLGEAVGREPRPAHVRRLDAARRAAVARARPRAGSSSTRTSASSSTRRASGRTSSSRSSRRARARSTRSTSRATTAGRSSTSRPTRRSTAASPRRCPEAWLEDPALDRRDDARPRAASRPRHLGRDHPLGRGHRGAALAAEDREREAVAVRLDRAPVRRVRLLRGARDRRVRRRPVGARRRAAGTSSSSPRSSTRTRRTTSRRGEFNLEPAPGLPDEPAHGHAARDRLPRPVARATSQSSPGTSSTGDQRERLELRAAARAERDRHLRDRQVVGRLDDVHEVVLAERGPLVEHLRAHLLDVAVDLGEPRRVRVQGLDALLRQRRQHQVGRHLTPFVARRASVTEPPGRRRGARRRGRAAARGRRRRGRSPSRTVLSACDSRRSARPRRTEDERGCTSVASDPAACT